MSHDVLHRRIADQEGQYRQVGDGVLGRRADVAAFVRCHNNALKGKQVSSKDMYSIAELEELTGFTYFPNVPNAPKDSYKASDWGL